MDGSMLASLGSGFYLEALKFWIDSGATPNLPSGCTPENAKRISINQNKWTFPAKTTPSEKVSGAKKV